MRIAVIASGELGFYVLKQIHGLMAIEFVMTDKNSDLIEEFCVKNEIPVFIGNPRNKLSKIFYSRHKIDVLISVNYLFLIDKNLIDHPKLFCFNIHGSLLPKYRGRTPHIWSIINNEKITGITAHIIDEGCDTGDILEQIQIDIEEEDTGAMILLKYKERYFELITSVLMKIQSGTLKPKQQFNEYATVFGKRSPKDGIINWDWQKERIKNWVRAQAHPYPGAFTFFKKNNLTIDRVSFSNYGFDNKIHNGTILTIVDGKAIVKTSNGAIVLEEVREQINFKQGNKLGNED